MGSSRHLARGMGVSSLLCGKLADGTGGGSKQITYKSIVPRSMFEHGRAANDKWQMTNSNVRTCSDNCTQVCCSVHFGAWLTFKEVLLKIQLCVSSSEMAEDRAHCFASIRNWFSDPLIHCFRREREIIRFPIELFDSHFLQSNDPVSSTNEHPSRASSHPCTCHSALHATRVICDSIVFSIIW